LDRGSGPGGYAFLLYVWITVGWSPRSTGCLRSDIELPGAADEWRGVLILTVLTPLAYGYFRNQKLWVVILQTLLSLVLGIVVIWVALGAGGALANCFGD
jgi:hypothetical protein